MATYLEGLLARAPVPTHANGWFRQETSGWKERRRRRRGRAQARVRRSER